MKNENEIIRTLFEKIGPDEAAVTRMEKNILSASISKPRRKFRPAVLAAAVLAAVLAVGTISASPSVRRYFFPDEGIVEMTENDEAPLYMMLDPENMQSTGYDIIAGYWHDGSARVWITSQKKYEDIPVSDLFENADASIELLGVHYDSISGYSQTYLLEYTDISWDAAYEGVCFKDDRLCFVQAPVEYRPYVLENCGIRLTLIPLTRDLTTFAAEAEYVDGHDTLEIRAKSIYASRRNDYCMFLTDEHGTSYPLKNLTGSIFTIDAVPKAEITDFTADYIVVNRHFDDSTIIQAPLPADGEFIETDIGFTFTDGVTKGNISAVGYNNPIYKEPYAENDPSSPYAQLKEAADSYPLGYLSVITDMIAENGVEYWYQLAYTDEYYEFLSRYIIMESRSPYDNSPMNPLAPKQTSSFEGLDGQVRHIEHYVPDGNDTVKLEAHGYYGIAYGDWSIDFTSAQ